MLYLHYHFLTTELWKDWNYISLYQASRLNEADMGAACRSKTRLEKSCIEPLLFIDS